MQPTKGHVTTAKNESKAYGRGYAIRIDDGVLCPCTDNILRQPNIRRWDGPMTEDYVGPTAEALKNRLDFLDGKSASLKRKVEVAAGQPFDVENASKDEILEFIMDEFGDKIDARQNIQTVRKQARDIIAAHKSA